MKNDAKPKKTRKTLYLDSKLSSDIEKIAEKDSRSFNAFVILLLEECKRNYIRI